MKKAATTIVLTTTLLTGCFNMPTKPEQITGMHVSEVKYADYDCNRLAVEADILDKRESQLVAAQQQRISDSHAQGTLTVLLFLVAIGKGDGTEANELSNVRGERDAIRRAMVANQCSGNSETLPELKQDEQKQDGSKV